ncbi:HpcH/HpaI aldolase family protein [Asanoa siamensis]|uniref:HpcH/HpaI aldolase family protein n=1 Tax=Asanoa siamensis TaxID=926357 RepID=UPI0019439ACC|nr:aldolase/citrate lyase family protein [Asanoa siamensis]
MDSPEVSEALACCGLDWLLIDMEHAPTLDAGRVQRIIQAIPPSCRTVVRVPANDGSWIGMALDTGCDGVLIPNVETPADAVRAVSAAKYPLAGRRRVGVARAHGYGTRFDEYLRTANDPIAVIVQVEDEAAVDNTDGILAVPGVAAAFVVPSGLSDSMGWPGTPDHRAVIAAIDHVRVRCREAGVPIGVFAPDPTAAVEQTDRGVDLLAVGTDLTLLTDSVHAALAQLRGPSDRLPLVEPRRAY